MLAQELKLTRIQKKVLRQGILTVVDDKKNGDVTEEPELKESPAQLACRQLMQKAEVIFFENMLPLELGEQDISHCGMKRYALQLDY